MISQLLFHVDRIESLLFRMHTVSEIEFEALICGAKLIEQDRRGPKVYESVDGKVIKLFRVKRWLSSNLVCPYALRFKRNAEHLAMLGIPSLHVELAGKVPHLDRQIVVYPWLPGDPLRHALRNATPQEAMRLMQSMGSFLALIHEKGVYFRSIHFGNVLVSGNDDVISLIDILDLKVCGGPLGAARRRRNFNHMIRYEEDRQNLRKQWTSFSSGYQACVLEHAPHRAKSSRDLLASWELELA